MSVVVNKISVAEFEAATNRNALLDAYADELAMDGLPHPKAKMEMYWQLEALTKLHIFGAYLDETLIGIVNVLMAENPHYGVDIAVTESIFVFKEHRKTGAGIKLLRAAEECAQSLGSPGIFVSAKVGSSLAAILEYNDAYVESNRTFFRKFK